MSCDNVPKPEAETLISLEPTMMGRYRAQGDYNNREACLCSGTDLARKWKEVTRAASAEFGAHYVCRIFRGWLTAMLHLFPGVDSAAVLTK